MIGSPTRTPLPPELDGASNGRGTVVIEPRQHGSGVRLRELWTSRKLLRFFARRALEKRYARTVLGKAWLIIRPALDVGSKALIFGGLLQAPSNGVPYVLFFVCGMGIWHLFDRSVYWATRGMELNRSLLKKLYFPRILLPIASAVPGFVEFAVYVGFMALALAGYALVDGTLYLQLGPDLLAVLGAMALAILLALGLGLWTSVLGARTRDVRFSLRYGLGFWFFLTPVIYPISDVPPPYDTIAMVNPMAPVVELFRFGLIDAGEVLPGGLVYCSVLVLVVLVSGLWFFSRAEAAAVDVL